MDFSVMASYLPLYWKAMLLTLKIVFNKESTEGVKEENEKISE